LGELAGELRQARARGGTVFWKPRSTDFDGFGRLRFATNVVKVGTTNVSRVLEYRYDLNGNRTRVIHPDGVFFEYGFDGLNRATSVSESGTSTLLNIEYRADGKRGRVLRPSAATTNYAFNNANRLASINHDFAGTADDFTNTFSYNPAGQITQLTLQNSLYHFGGNSNKTGAYVPNGLNQYTQINGVPVTHDANGNLAFEGSSAYTHDMENRLVGTTSPSSALAYDPLGRLSEYILIPANGVQFLYDGDALVAEYTVSGNTATLTRRYVHGDRVDEPWVQYNGSTVGPALRRYLHADHQGSIVAHSDSGGAVQAKLS
jgi:YD repeat-containing protein